MKDLWNKYFVLETEDTFIQFFRYLFVGGFAFVVDYAFSIILVYSFGLYDAYAAMISFIIGLIVNYILSTMWIFRKRKIANQSFDFIAFGIIGVVGMGIKAAIVWFLKEVPHLGIEFSNPIATVIVFIWNFMARKYLLYNDKKMEG